MKKNYKILFVCHGNICRSPMAEFMMKALVKEHGLEESILIESAAVSDEDYGNPIYPQAKRCMTQHGIPFDSSKRARTVTPSDYECYDLIICMDSSNLRWLSRGFGSDFSSDPDGKVHLMMSFAGSGKDVADPWYTGDFEATFSDLRKGLDALLAELRNQI